MIKVYILLFVIAAAQASYKASMRDIMYLRSTCKARDSALANDFYRSIDVNKISLFSQILNFKIINVVMGEEPRTTKLIKHMVIDEEDNDEKEEDLKIIANNISLHYNLSHSTEGTVYHAYPKVNQDNMCFSAEKHVDLILESFSTDLMEYMGAEGSNRLYDSLPWKLYASVHLALRVSRLHKAGYLYTFLNPSTIYMRSEFDMVLGDFSFAVPVSPSITGLINNYETLALSAFHPTYSPNELYQDIYSWNSDTYSLGIILHEIWTGKTHKGSEMPEDYRLSVSSICEDEPVNNLNRLSNDLIVRWVYCKYFQNIVSSMVEETFEMRAGIDTVIRKFKENADEAMKEYIKLKSDYEDELETSRNMLDGLKKIDPNSPEAELYVGIDDTIALLDEEIAFINDDIGKTKPLETVLIAFYKSMIEPRIDEPHFILRQLEDNEYIFSLLDDKGEAILSHPIGDYIKILKNKIGQTGEGMVFNDGRILI